MRIGENIKKRRKERGFTQKDLAAVSNLSQCYLSQLERGDKNPSMSTITALAASLKITIGELVGEYENITSGQI